MRLIIHTQNFYESNQHCFKCCPKVIILLFALCCKASFNCFITRNRYKICLVGNNYEITYQRDVDEIDIDEVDIRNVKRYEILS
jgi:hypothetical protein